MKKSFTLILLLITTLLNYAQSTTQEEYNYITKGFKIQTDFGLDMKEGYSLKRFHTITDNFYKADFLLLMRKEDSSTAGLMYAISFKKLPEEPGKGYEGDYIDTYYFCIPVGTKKNKLMADNYTLMLTLLKGKNEYQRSLIWGAYLASMLDFLSYLMED